MNDHHHDHHHHQAQAADGEVVFEAKLEKLIDHWIKHNNDHVENYRQWAQRAAENHFEEVADYLKKAADKTLEISEVFLEAKNRIKKGRV